MVQFEEDVIIYTATSRARKESNSCGIEVPVGVDHVHEIER